MAPLPKPPGSRRRTNTGQSQWKRLPAAGPDGAPPELPDAEWLPSTRSWWETLWTSPMACAYERGDIEPLIRLARLRDEFARGELPPSALSAVQALEDRFGLSPRARRQLQWEVERESEGTAESSAAPARERPRTLRAIER